MKFGIQRLSGIAFACARNLAAAPENVRPDTLHNTFIGYREQH